MRLKKLVLNPHELVLVKWLDAAGHRDKDSSDPVPCLSVGWIVELGEKDGKKWIKIASELLDGNSNETTGKYETQEHVSIPEGMVQKIIPLKHILPKPFDKWNK